jgi:hypothetical protein
MPGKGKQVSTGKLGDVMKESIAAAMTVVRARAGILGISDEAFQTQDLHIHVPEGATPKDGPRAGVGMCTAIVSALTSKNNIQEKFSSSLINVNKQLGNGSIIHRCSYYKHRHSNSGPPFSSFGSSRDYGMDLCLEIYL